MTPPPPSPRYLKLVRNMPQTKWNDPLTGKRIGGVSLAERIEALVAPAYAAEGTKFISGVGCVCEGGGAGLPRPGLCSTQACCVVGVGVRGSVTWRLLEV